MFSSLYPDLLSYTSISPSLSEKVNEYLVIFNRLHKVLLELCEKISGIHNMAANDLLSLVDTCNKKIVEVSKGLTNTSSTSILNFLTQFLNQISNQATTLKNMQTSLEETVVKPLREVVHKKKEMWKTCFHYVDNFSQQICKKETALQKCYKQYSDAATRLKRGNTMEKQLQIIHDLHNTYILKLTSFNSMNNVFYTHALPHVMQSIEANHAELNDKYRHQLSNLLYVQNDSWSRMVKFDDNMKTLADNLNIVDDLRHYIRLSNDNLKDKSPTIVQYALPKVDEPKVSRFTNLDACFIVSERTRPNLQRRFASLQQQTEELLDDITSRRSVEKQKIDVFGGVGGEFGLTRLVEDLSICDKESNLNVLLKQTELYTEDVVNFLGPIPQNILLENKHSKKTLNKPGFISSFTGEMRPHEFIEPRVMKPISCFYCEKLIALIGKGYVCKVCKVSVHKKCATSVKFCEPLLRHPKTTPSAPPESIVGSPKSNDGDNRNSFVSNLIELDSDDDYYDHVDEFDDGFSEESDGGGDAIYSSIQTRLENSNSLNLKHVNNTQNTNLLDDDMIDFGSDMRSTQPVYDNPHDKTALSAVINSIKQKKSNGFLDSSESRPLYHEVVPDDDEIYANTTISMKPTVPKKPSITKSPIQLAKPGCNPLATKPKCGKPPIIGPKPSLSTTPSFGSSTPPLPPKKKPIVTDTKNVSIAHISVQHSTKCFCVSLYDFHGSDETHLSFTSGSKLELLEKSSSEWWHGEFNGFSGYFPSQYVLEINEWDTILRVMYDFSKEAEYELNVQDGEIVILLKKEDQWLTVRSKDGEGLIPTTYIEFI